MFNNKEHVYQCAICGNQEFLGNYKTDEISSIMKERNVCFHCAFWINKILHPPRHSIVINGVYYIIPNIQIKGHKYQYILTHNKQLIQVPELVSQGNIPRYFQDNLPDNAIFISEKIYNKLAKDDHVCSAKGCWDRYQCFRYNIEIEKKYGAWNIIPNNHKIGDEHCPSFINKFKMNP